MKRVICVIALFGAVITASAAEVEKAISLSMEEAVNIALSENPTIKIAELEVERYDYVRKTTMGSLLPQISVDGTLNQTLQSQSMARGFSFGGDQYTTMTATGNVSLALYAPTVYRTLKMNNTEAEAAVESARSSRIELVAAVKGSFYAVMLAERSLEVLLESSKTSKETMDETQVKFDNGLSAEYDLLTAQVQYSNLQPTIIATRSSIENAKNLLKMYLSIPLDVEVQVKGDLDDLHDMVVRKSANLSRDISGNSSLRSLALSEEILSHQLRINNATRLPTLSAYGTINYTGNNMDSFSLDGSDTDTTATSDFFWQTPSSVGLSLSIPIFSGLTRTNTSRQIKNQISQLELQRRYTEDSVNVSLSTAISDINSAREQLFAQQQTVDQAIKAYEISNTRYTAGAGTILELNTARLTMTQAELNLSQAIYDLLIAKAEYDRIIGVE
ncbi:MAG: TolC family protein [Rikenellaceae bacterium]